MIPIGIARNTLITDGENLRGHKNQAAVKASLDAWFAEASKAGLASSAGVKQSYATAGIITAVSEVLNRRRGLSIEMIRALHDQLRLPAEVLIRPSKLLA